MTNIIKLSIFAGVLAIAFGIFAFLPAISDKVEDTVFAPIAALAWGSDTGGCCSGGGGGGGGGGGNDWGTDTDGCCDYSQGNYYGQGGYYSEGSYYSEGGYYSESYYQSTYNVPASCDSFTGSPTSLPYGGGSVTLAWATTNATAVSINQGIGSVSADGSTSVNVTQTTTFVLTADGTGGDDDCSVTITVQPQSAANCDSFTASPNSFNNGVGGQVTLTWNTTNANSVSINNGVGSVSADGSTNVNVTDDITYILTAVGTNGTDTCEAPITVTETNDVLSCDFFNASPSNINNAQNITLSWGTTGANSVSIDNGVGSVSADGSIEVYVNNDRTYTLTLSNGNNTKTCQASVNLDSGGGGGGGGSSSPRCELEISDKKVKVGEKVTLSWDTSRATKVEIEDDKGNEIFSTDDYSSSKKSDYYDGEIDVIINRDTEFELTASKGSKDRTCKVEVEVEDSIKVYEKRDQPLVISLREVPYTGFEAGPMLTALFYALLAIWALFVAYIVVFKKNPLMGFKLKTNTEVAEADAALEYKKKVQNLAAMHSHQPWN